MTVAIAFNGGAYGTYLEWVLTTLVGDSKIVPPFRNDGGSHNFSGNSLYNIHSEEWKSFTKNPDQFLFVRLHPKTKLSDKLSDNLRTILEYADRLLYIYPDEESILLNINNNYQKIKSDWWDHKKQTDPEFINDLYRNWNIDYKLPLNDIPLWIKREYLSYNLMPAWFSEVEWRHIDEWQHDHSKTILIKDLLFDFENLILKIQKFCNLEFKQNISDLMPYHIEMLALQKNLSQDDICFKIVNSILNNNMFDWSKEYLPLPSQSWIQWRLRNLGYEMRCVGIDIFPTNSMQLSDLLYTS